MIIFSHRGLEPSKKNFYAESSIEAFRSHLERSFGIEFDLNFCKNGAIIFHDSGLGRITLGRDKREFDQLSISEIKNIEIGKRNKIATFDEILELIEKNKSELNALHLKGKFQNTDRQDILIEHLKKYPALMNKVLIFDVGLEAAKYLKSALPEVQIAPSVAHKFDIKRYNSFVSGTLLSVEDALKNKKLYDWVWLDEWDTLDEGGKEKFLYTKEVFDKLRKTGYKIALVTPELHGTSPGLYGGESHRDSVNKKVLFERIKKIIQLNPDALCTDYPEEVRQLAEETNKNAD